MIANNQITVALKLPVYLQQDIELYEEKQALKTGSLHCYI